ncbi:transcription/translation regulatory transformer protein RfaH [Pusillimonas sp. T2]|uniref:transcription/translation regulatory transformer protein RfaH n=1 Tax=Pusillimonas sp. T2 TaxID=1548123 RepID=UPI000B9CFD49|nr:transcription/translation regulatory transformer protein RfaH [Pusillimonas sp. T2]OXR50236.1 transcription/translation regulatory transformer protein RfaH [Pusillimonas sp. T2]
MCWHLVHTKPKQEKIALDNLRRQGYECYLPSIQVEKLRHRNVVISCEPLFPRYLFIKLAQGNPAKSWSPIRSTKGVNRLVCFGTKPAQVDDQFIASLQTHEAAQSEPQRLFKPGQRVYLTLDPFAGLEAIYQMTDSERRAMVLIEILSRPVAVTTLATNLRKAD